MIRPVFFIMIFAMFGFLAGFKSQTGAEFQNTTMENKMKIEIWSDIMCPFCYIGKRHLETALSQFSFKDQVDIEWKSFQLDPTIPEFYDYQDIYQFLAERKGFSYEQSKKMHDDLVRYAKSVGLDYHFDKAIITNSLKAHRLIQAAKAKGLGAEAEERLFYAYFTEGKNVSDVNTLMALGKAIGLSEAEVNDAMTNPVYLQKVESDTREAQALGDRGVPFFVMNRKYAIVGAQPPNEMLGALEKAFSEWRKEHPNQLEIQDGSYCEPSGECK
jgi:predicted DsbA family dithiol-disulfide isomerase